MNQNIKFVRIIFLSALFLKMSSISFSQFTKDRHHVKDSLSKHNVSTYRIFEYSENNKDSTLKEILSFDRKGNLIKEFDPTYDILITYKYDSLDRLTERTEICPGIINETEYYYYDSNKLLSSKRMDSTGFVNRNVEYNYKNSRLISERIVSFYKSRNVKNVLDVTYEYDSSGLRVIELRPDSTFKVEIERNEYGGIVYYKMTNSSNNAPEPVWFNYDKNLRTEQYRFFNDNKIISEKMIYNFAGLIMEIQTCGDEHFNFPCRITTKFYYEYFEE